jgi:hypothetical protein
VINDTTLFAATALQRYSTLNMANFNAAMADVAHLLASDTFRKTSFGRRRQIAPVAC